MDQTAQNKSRAIRAQATIDQYMGQPTTEREDQETAVCDIIADCCHLLGPEAVHRALLAGIGHWTEESGGRRAEPGTCSACQQLTGNCICEPTLDPQESA